MIQREQTRCFQVQYVDFLAACLSLGVLGRYGKEKTRFTGEGVAPSSFYNVE